MKQIGKNEAEKEYEKLIEVKEKEYKTIIANLKSEHKNQLDSKIAELQKFVNEFKVYHAQKKTEVHLARKELISLYNHSKQQTGFINSILDGKMTGRLKAGEEKLKTPLDMS
jgi:F0F1-type ATP synthase membrane subunit b/b'